MRDLLHILLLSLAMGVVVWIAVRLLPTLWLQLTLGTAGGVVFYIGVARLLHFEEWTELTGLIRKKGKH